MEAERIRIEGPAEALEAIQRDLEAELGDQLEVEPVSTAVPGELREPVLVGLILTAGAAIAKVAGGVIERNIQYRERMDELRFYEEKSKEQIAVGDLGRNP